MTEDFFLTLNRASESGLWYFWVLGVGSKEDMSKFRCRIKVYESNTSNSSSSSSECFTYNGDVMHIDTDFEVNLRQVDLGAMKQGWGTCSTFKAFNLRS